MKNALAKLVLALLMLVLFASQSQAGNAGLLLSPTRVVLENGAKFTTVTVRNTGDSTGRYKIELVDTVMSENGGIKVLEEGKKSDTSAIDMINLSPRNLTLKPNESQVVRIIVKPNPDAADGEYRSHLQVRMTENDLDADKTAAPEGVGIAIKTKMTTIIPLIVRKGQTDYKLTIDDAQLVSAGGDNKKSPEVNLKMSLSGNRSLLCDIKVTHIAPDSKETQLAFFQGIAIYREATKRTQPVKLEVPESLDIKTGRFRVDVLSQETEGSHVLGEKEITP